MPLIGTRDFQSSASLVHRTSPFGLLSSLISDARVIFPASSILASRFQVPWATAVSGGINGSIPGLTDVRVRYLYLISCLKIKVLLRRIACRLSKCDLLSSCIRNCPWTWHCEALGANQSGSFSIRQRPPWHTIRCLKESTMRCPTPLQVTPHPQIIRGSRRDPYLSIFKLCHARETCRTRLEGAIHHCSTQPQIYKHFRELTSVTSSDLSRALNA